MGSTPTEFDGDRVKADQFINKLQHYFHMNATVPGLQSWIRCIAIALTFIKGPTVDEWALNQGDWVDRLDPLIEDVPDVWINFLNEFQKQFQDTQAEEQARLQIENMKMKWPESRPIHSGLRKSRPKGRIPTHGTRNRQILPERTNQVHRQRHSQTPQGQHLCRNQTTSNRQRGIPAPHLRDVQTGQGHHEPTTVITMESVRTTQSYQPTAQPPQHPRVQLHQRPPPPKQRPRPDGRRRRPSTCKPKQQLEELKPPRKDSPDAGRTREHLPSKRRPNPTDQPEPPRQRPSPPRRMLRMQPSQTLRVQLPQPKEETTHSYRTIGRLDVRHHNH